MTLRPAITGFGASLLLFVGCIAVCRSTGLDLLTRMVPARCSLGELLQPASTEETCRFLRAHCDPTANALALAYYCRKGWWEGYAIVCFVAVCLGMMFVALGITAADYLCPNLSYATRFFGLSQRVAGITLMAYGNGAPDLFSTYSLIRSGSPGLAFGELIGAANFCVCFIVGVMALCCSFQVDSRQFGSDLAVFLVLLIVSLVFVCDGKLTLLESLIMIAIYVAYIGMLLRLSAPDHESTGETESLLPPPDRLWAASPVTSLGSRLSPSLGDSHPRFSVYDALKLWSTLDERETSTGDASLTKTHPGSPPQRLSDQSRSRCISPYSGLSGSFRSCTPPPHLQLETRDLTPVALSPQPVRVGVPVFMVDGILGSSESSPIPSLSASPTPNATLISPPSPPVPYRVSMWRFLLPDVALVVETLREGKRPSPFTLLLTLLMAPFILLFNATIPTVCLIHQDGMGGGEGEEDSAHEECTAQLPLKVQLLYFQWGFLPVLVDAHYFSLTTVLSDLWALRTPLSALSHLALLVVVCGVVILSFHAVFRQGTATPKSIYPVISLLGFLVSIVWINVISDRVVYLLSNLGLILGVGDSLMGLTFFALGNSVGDLVGNITLARAHLPLTGLGACFGAPLLYIVLGLGVNGVVLILTQTNGAPIEFEFDLSLVIVCGGLLAMLAVYAAVVPLNGWVIGRRLGLFGMVWWMLVTGLSVYVDV